MIFNEVLKKLVWFCLAIIPFLAWYVAESMFFPFITGKNFGFRVLTEVAFAAWALLSIREVKYRLKGSIVFYCYGAFLAVLLVADLLGVDPYRSIWGNYERMEGFVTHAHLFLYFIVLYAFLRTTDAWNKILGYFMVANVAVLMDGYFQLFGSKFFFVSSIFKEQPRLLALIDAVYGARMVGGIRLDSTLGNAAYYGIYTLFYFCLALVLMAKAEGKKTDGLFTFFGVFASAFFIVFSKVLTAVGGFAGLDLFMKFVGIIALIYFAVRFANEWAHHNIGKLVFGIIMVLNLVQLYYTQTRGSYMGLIAGAIVSMFCIIVAGRKKHVKLFKTSVLGIMSVLLLVTAFFTFKDTSIIKGSIALNRLATIKIFNPSAAINALSDPKVNYKQLLDIFGETTIVSRMLNAKISYEGWSESAKTMLIGYGQDNYPKVFAKHFDPRMYAQETWFDRSHNVFFDWMVAAGGLGLITYLALYFSPFYMMWFSKGKANMSILEKSALTGLLVAYFIHNVFVFDNLTSYILFFFVLAYIASRTRATDKDIASEERIKSNIGNNTFYGAIAATALLLVGAIYIITIKPLQANLSIINIFRYSQYMSQSESAKAADLLAPLYSKTADMNTFGNYELREQALQQATTINTINPSASSTPEFRTSLNNLKQTFVASALSDYIAYTQKDTEDLRAKSLLTLYYANMNDTANALKYAEEGYKLSPLKQASALPYAQLLMYTNDGANIVKANAILKALYEADPTYDTVEKAYKQSENLLHSKTATSTPTTTAKVVPKAK